MTDYSKDDKHFWRGFRRELVKDGYPSMVIRGHKKLIRDYIRELEVRRVLDDPRGRSSVSLATFAGVQERGKQVSIGSNQSMESFVSVTANGEERFSESPRNPNIHDSEFSGSQPRPSTSTQFHGQVVFAAQSKAVVDEEFPGILLDKDLPPASTPPPTADELRILNQRASIEQKNLNLGNDSQIDTPPLESNPTLQTSPNSQHLPDDLQGESRTISAVKLDTLLPQLSSPDVAEMARRLAFLKQHTLEQEKKLEAATNQQQQKAEEKEIILAATRVAETKAALRPLEPIDSAAGSSQPQPKLSSATTMSGGSYSPITTTKEGQVMDPKAAARVREYSSVTRGEEAIDQFSRLPRTKIHIPLLHSEDLGEIIGPRVLQGWYDLLSKEFIIMPQVWEDTIEPDCEVTMHMWPLPEPPLRCLPPGPPPLPRRSRKPKKKGGVARRILGDLGF
ncbi:hypothetical protein G7Y89_g8562 [Cudoniella acicularis]|uniref:Ubiquitin-like domain-containing protein n=1 Tax=Cudoniella acicularis TaxID=354080 RepID=A0A8H4RH95_9HELO|nr:hypothetical protein G7Y89_g8562 [Cudoniella acicularis]